MRSILIYGAGGFGREVLELLRDINSVGEQWDVKGFLSDEEGEHGAELNGLSVLGDIGILEENPGRFFIALGVGNPQAKSTIAASCAPFAAGFPSLVHPSVVMSDSVQLSPGTVVTAGNILTANIEIGSYAMLNLACTIGHDCVLGSYVTVSPGVSVSGYVSLGEGCDIGTGSSIIQGVSIGHWSLIGAGAVVTTDLPNNCTAVGVPARAIKEREEGWHLK